jgi:hypothetical protein
MDEKHTWWINSILDIAEEKMSEFKDTVIEIMLREMGRPKKTHEQ